MPLHRLETAAAEALFDALTRRGYTIVGPTVRDGAIVLGELASPEALPIGWTEVHAPGRYRLERRGDSARFGFTVGPHAWKRFLHPSALKLWRAERSEAGGFEVRHGDGEPPRYALLGVRPCDLHAIRIQDRVFTGGVHVDHDYEERRSRAFVIAVNCTEPAGTCFCASMGTGPRAEAGFDLALTELLDGDDHAFLLEAGSEAGEAVLAELPTTPASDDEVRSATAALDAAAGRMGRVLDTDGLAEALAAQLEHPRWDEVAARCVACGNCTLACPTCFCTTVVDSTDLTGAAAERTRLWDSCFTLDYSYIHGGSVRPTTRSRYRQWLTHKLSTWWEQFGTQGCVGCGRCITWCPVGIDITEEASAIAGTRPSRATPARRDDDARPTA
jgi:sulfhydrogenase subunit beta (sulfur reductase)